VHRYSLFLSALVLAAGMWQLTARAQEPASGCVNIDDDQARLACFDAASGRLGPNGKSQSAVVPQNPVPAGVVQPAVTDTIGQTELPAKRSTADFGLSDEQTRAPEPGPSAISAKVTSVAAQQHIGRWVVTLDNGQVWQQRETTSESKRPRPGDEVTIREASLGSYLLYIPNRGLSRVKRIR
jgi:hypothetical protein